MLKEKCHCGIKQFINVTFRTLVVYKLFFCCSSETSHTHKALWIAIQITYYD